jgi:hypothetical protein
MDLTFVVSALVEGSPRAAAIHMRFPPPNDFKFETAVAKRLAVFLNFRPERLQFIQKRI